LSLVKTSFFSAIVTLIKVMSGFIANKVVAIFAGASGVAGVGDFSNFLSIVFTFANGAINTGVVKYTAENDEVNYRKSLFSTSIRITIYCSFFVGLLLLVFASFWSQIIFTKPIYTNPIRFLGISVVFYAVNSLLISILNGRNLIKTYTIVNALGSILGLVFTIVLVYFYNIIGALYALVFSQSIVLFITVGIVYKNKIFVISDFTEKFNKQVASKLSHYSLMAIVSAMTIPVSQIIIRNHLIKSFGIDQAGYWQGVVRVSDAYLMLITTSLATYFLPKLASLKTNFELREEVIKGYKLIIPTVLLGCVSIYFLRFLIIKILFTPEFSAMESLFFWQLIGDFFKMAAWILAYIMLAKAMTKIYIISEILISLCYVLLGFWLVSVFKIEGAVLAYAINYFLYFVFLAFLFRKLLFHKNNVEV